MLDAHHRSRATSTSRPESANTPWVQRAGVVVQGEVVGAIEVYYTRQMPRADEGPFLKEERRLINTIAEWVAHLLMQRRLQTTLRNWTPAEAAVPEPAQRREWWVIIDFLRKTDHQLLTRIGRRMINHLCWNGIEEAQLLLERSAADLRDPSGVWFEDNRPLEKRSEQHLLTLTNEAFRIAAEYLSEREIIACIEQWIKDDKSSFLIEAVEDQGTSRHRDRRRARALPPVRRPGPRAVAAGAGGPARLAGAPPAHPQPRRSSTRRGTSSRSRTSTTSCTTSSRPPRATASWAARARGCCSPRRSSGR